MRSQWLVWLFIVVIGAEKASACSYPEPPSFAESLKDASSVFVFQLMGTKLVRETEGTGYYEYIEGSIRPVLDLKGKSTRYKTITFRYRFCGGLLLNTGYYFLLATNANGSEVNLMPDDKSILNFNQVFVENAEEFNGRSRILKDIKSALAGEIDPATIDFLPYVTYMLPPDIVPAPEAQSSREPSEDEDNAQD